MASDDEVLRILAGHPVRTVSHNGDEDGSSGKPVSHTVPAHDGLHGGPAPASVAGTEEMAEEAHEGGHGHYHDPDCHECREEHGCHDCHGEHRCHRHSHHTHPHHKSPHHKNQHNNHHAPSSAGKGGKGTGAVPSAATPGGKGAGAVPSATAPGGSGPAAIGSAPGASGSGNGSGSGAPGSGSGSGSGAPGSGSGSSPGGNAAGGAGSGKNGKGGASSPGGGAGAPSSGGGAGAPSSGGAGAPSPGNGAGSNSTSNPTDQYKVTYDELTKIANDLELIGSNLRYQLTNNPAFANYIGDGNSTPYALRPGDTTMFLPSLNVKDAYSGFAQAVAHKLAWLELFSSDAATAVNSANITAKYTENQNSLDASGLENAFSNTYSG